MERVPENDARDVGAPGMPCSLCKSTYAGKKMVKILTPSHHMDDHTQSPLRHANHFDPAPGMQIGPYHLLKDIRHMLLPVVMARDLVAVGCGRLALVTCRTRIRKPGSLRDGASSGTVPEQLARVSQDERSVCSHACLIGGPFPVAVATHGLDKVHR